MLVESYLISQTPVSARCSINGDISSGLVYIYLHVFVSHYHSYIIAIVHSFREYRKIILLFIIKLHHGIKALNHRVPDSISDVVDDSLEKLSANPASKISQAFSHTWGTSNVLSVLVLEDRNLRAA